jgi:hypothetical protein
MTTDTYANRIEALRDFGYANDLELSISQRDDRLYFSIDNWNTGEQIEDSYPMEGATFALNMSFIRARMETILEEAK